MPKTELIPIETILDEADKTFHYVPRYVLNRIFRRELRSWYDTVLVARECAEMHAQAEARIWDKLIHIQTSRTTRKNRKS